MSLIVLAAAAAALAGPLSLSAQVPGCAPKTSGGGIVCNFFEGAGGAPSPAYLLGRSVNPGYVIWTTHYDTDYANTQFWTNVLRFANNGSGQATTAQLFSDPFGQNGTPAFTWADVTSGAYVFEAYTPAQPMDYDASPNTYHVYADQEPELSVTPEPGSLGLIATGLVGLVPAVRRRRERLRQ